MVNNRNQNLKHHFLNNLIKLNNKNLTITKMIRSNILILQFGLLKKKNF